MNPNGNAGSIALDDSSGGLFQRGNEGAFPQDYASLGLVVVEAVICSLNDNRSPHRKTLQGQACLLVVVKAEFQSHTPSLGLRSEPDVLN